jgi:hypothetical protein
MSDATLPNNTENDTTSVEVDGASNFGADESTDASTPFLVAHWLRGIGEG